MKVLYTISIKKIFQVKMGNIQSNNNINNPNNYQNNNDYNHQYEDANNNNDDDGDEFNVNHACHESNILKDLLKYRRFIVVKKLNPKYSITIFKYLIRKMESKTIIITNKYATNSILENLRTRIDYIKLHWKCMTKIEQIVNDQTAKKKSSSRPSTIMNNNMMVTATAISNANAKRRCIFLKETRRIIMKHDYKHFKNIIDSSSSSSNVLEKKHRREDAILLKNHIKKIITNLCAKKNKEIYKYIKQYIRLINMAFIKLMRMWKQLIERENQRRLIAAAAAAALAANTIT